MKKHRKLNIKRIMFIILSLLIISIIIYLVQNGEKVKSKLNINLKSMGDIGEIENKNYKGRGQEKGNEKEGYPTIFSTDGENPRTYFEYKQNENAPWANNKYWGGTMAENGCGITSISIIASGFVKNGSEKDITPETLRKQYYPHLDDENIPNIIEKKLNIKSSDFYFSEVQFSKEKLIAHLKQNKPVLICVWNKPHDRWTTKSHYMVLSATDGNDKVYVSNPKKEKDKSKISGWYDIDEVLPYIAKASFIGID